jgi:arginine-tRNA-protein transferase
MDEVPDAISLVYYFHDPTWRPLSPGTYSVMVQLQYARERGLRYAYPGYWVAANDSMNYKIRFRPHERLKHYPTDDEPPLWVRD